MGLFASIPGPEGRGAGSPGPAGAIGPAGPAGPEGPQGPVGPDGPQGTAGATGAAGAAGSAGATGPAGSAGATGPTGPKGDQGNDGPAGPQGIAGETGPQGDQGPAGPAGDGGEGAAGPVGPTGPRGVTGLQGIQGQQGPAGPQGAEGATGAQGATGPRGATGDRGQVGATGAQGAQGTIGPTGATGRQGGPGPSGPTGATGPRGPAGMIWFNSWNPLVIYPEGYVVERGGSSYIAKIQTYVGEDPLEQTGAWGLVAAKGEDGAPGADGADGVDGASGGAPSRLDRLVRGLIFVDYFGGVNGETIGYAGFDSPGAFPWLTMNGSWSINASGRLTNDASNYATLLLDEEPRGEGVIEYSFLGSATAFAGGVALASPKAASFAAYSGIGTFFTNGNQQLSYKVATEADTHEGVAAHAPMTAGQEYRVKHHFAQLRGARDAQHSALWLDRTRLAFTNPYFNLSAGYNDRGLVGLQTYGAAPSYGMFAYYRNRWIIAHGLTGTETLAVVDENDVILASANLNSGANQGRVAIDSTLFNNPTKAHYQVFTSTSFATPVADGRYPSVGELPDIAGGDRLILSPA